MKIFGNQIKGNSVEDFVSWWELRTHYIENDVRLTEHVLNVFLTGALIASFVMILLSLESILLLDSITGIHSWTVKFLIITFIILACFLYLGQNATFYYGTPLRHEHMLTREILRIKSYVNKRDGDVIKPKQVENILNVIDAIIDDVRKTVTAIKVAGFTITPRVMNVIRGYVGTAVITIVSLFFYKN